MKKNFRPVNLPKMKYTGSCLCKRCGKEFDSSELVCGVQLTGHDSLKLYAHWYCPTEVCNGYLNSGVYFKTTA